MKVNIGPYTKWVGPYQIADLLKVVGVSDDACHKIGRKLSNTWLMKLCNFIESKKSRKIKVRIDNYDVWGADHTMALIILPILKKLKETKHGSPIVDDEDVPEDIRSGFTEVSWDWGCDEHVHERWNYVLDKMIWSFEQIIDDSWEDQFYSGEIDLDFVPIKDSELFEAVKTEKDTHSFDNEGYTAYNQRISEGLILFGKYYRGLWS